jgi:MerR family mercuric resistance operon transcriptional regulator
MRIGEMATQCSCSVETIRYYERVGLLPKPLRRLNGYREYQENHLKWLQFILKSRALGFSQDEVRGLLEVAEMSHPDCGQVHGILSQHLAGVDQKLADLERMKKALQRLQQRCESGDFVDCPVIDELMAS